MSINRLRTASLVLLELLAKGPFKMRMTHEMRQSSRYWRHQGRRDTSPKSLDRVEQLDTILVTMIRRRPQSDRKQRALEESGTVNPHARDVRDPAFVDSEFFDPRDLIQVKYEMLRRVQTEGQSVAKASASFGVSRPTFYKAQSDFDRAGLVGLLPAKRGPRGPHKVTPEVARFIEETVARGEELDPQRLAECVAERFGLVVHQRTVKRALARSKKKAR
jgi:transposase